ncbi:MAG: 2-keto-4-pentenoate hydratase [Janthinobacterium lividum]
MDDARDIQDFAVECLDGRPIGYTLAATTRVTSRLLNCCEVVSGTLMDDFVYDSGAIVGLPYGALGIGAQFIFVIGSSLREPYTAASVSNAIVSCRMGLQLLGRRASRGLPIDDWSATADFALDVGCVRGAEIAGWDPADLGAIRVSLRVGGYEMARNDGPDVFGDPLGALVDLARSLHARGGSLEAGDVVATGSCTGLTQIVPGQHIAAIFPGHGEVEVNVT